MSYDFSYYHLDHLNSTKCVSDETGTVEVRYVYRAFGSQLAKIGSGEAKYTYSGKELDEENGLYYFNARYYDAEIGRFISVDPAKDGLNWYVYFNNNPLRFVDPTGLKVEGSSVFSQPKYITESDYWGTINKRIDLMTLFTFSKVVDFLSNLRVLSNEDKDPRVIKWDQRKAFLIEAHDKLNEVNNCIAQLPEEFNQNNLEIYYFLRKEQEALKKEIIINEDADRKQLKEIRESHESWGVYFEDKRPEKIEEKKQF